MQYAKKILTIMLMGLGLFLSSTLAQPNPVDLTFTQTAGRTVTDSILVPGGMIPVSIRVLNITNAITAVPRFSFGRKASIFYDLLEAGSSSDLTVALVDSSVSPIDANSVQSIMGTNSASDKVWMQLRLAAAEAAIAYYIVRFRYF
jgi:hypothetical protein